MRLSNYIAGILGAVLLPFVAGAFVVAQARGDRQVDALGPAFFTFLVWWSLPVAIAIAASMRQPRWAIPGAALVVSVVFTAWTLRPQAPTGRDHTEHLADGTRDVHRMVEELVASVGTVRFEQDYTDLAPCEDVFGRTRGALRRNVSGDVRPALRPAERTAGIRRLRREGWTVSVGRDAFVAERAGYEISFVSVLRSDQVDLDSVYAQTACLRP